MRLATQAQTLYAYQKGATCIHNPSNLACAPHEAFKLRFTIIKADDHNQAELNP